MLWSASKWRSRMLNVPNSLWAPCPDVSWLMQQRDLHQPGCTVVSTRSLTGRTGGPNDTLPCQQSLWHECIVVAPADWHEEPDSTEFFCNIHAQTTAHHAQRPPLCSKSGHAPRGRILAGGQGRTGQAERGHPRTGRGVPGLTHPDTRASPHSCDGAGKLCIPLSSQSAVQPGPLYPGHMLLQPWLISACRAQLQEVAALPCLR